SRRLARVWVSSTQRRSGIAAVVAQQLRKHACVHAGGLGALADRIAKALELGAVQLRQSLVLLHRHDDGHVALLAPDHDRLARGGVDELGKGLTGLAGGNGIHDRAVFRQLTQIVRSVP
ncbi:MAG TPA: hypothetical protein P5163_10515, partial [Rubrivivax sp.]|nr:hypothetical protein [Rubrivivax sp.]HRZ61017.1 hypothetical protein [Rubrivivax sp.]